MPLPSEAFIIHVQSPVKPTNVPNLLNLIYPTNGLNLIIVSSKLTFLLSNIETKRPRQNS